MSKILRQLKDKISTMNKVNHPLWDYTRLDPHHNNFDKNYYQSRRHYLMSVKDADALHLNNIDAYDRVRFMGDMENIAKFGLKEEERPSPPKKEFVRVNHYVGVSHNKSWLD
jgi:hypothetical protein